MSDRFYLAATDHRRARVTLDGQEAHHLLHVMRAKVGERVTLFDGSGAEFEAEIAKCGRSEVEAPRARTRAKSTANCRSNWWWAFRCRRAIGRSGWWKSSRSWA